MLCTINRQVPEAKDQGQSTLSAEQTQSFETRYQTIVELGFAANPTLPPPLQDTPKKRGRPKQSPPS